MSFSLLDYNVRSEAELERVINGLGSRREIFKQIKQFGDTKLLETDARDRLVNELCQLVLDKNSAQHSMGAQPPTPAAPPTGVPPSTGGQSAPQSTPQTSVANLWTVDKLYGFIAGELNFDPKGPLSLVDMAKQHCLEKGIAHTSNELGAYWQRLKEKNATSIKCWMGGMISVFTLLLYVTLLFEMDRSENWGHDGPNKDIKAEEADNAFLNHCWRAVVFFLLVANSCFLWRHPKKLWNAFRAVVLILMIHLTMIYYHWSNDHISNEQGFMWSVPLAVVNGGFFLVVWCFN